MDSIIKRKKLQDPIIEVPQITKAFMEELKGNICEPLVVAGEVSEFLTYANEYRKLIPWYDKDNNLVGILVYALDQPWWTNELVVVEVMILSLDKKVAGIQRLAIKELHRIARSYNSRLIASGNLLSKEPQLVANGYHKAGFQFEHSVFIKRLKGEQDND